MRWNLHALAALSPAANTAMIPDGWGLRVMTSWADLNMYFFFFLTSCSYIIGFLYFTLQNFKGNFD